MAQMIIRNLPDEIYQALKARAASRQGRNSAEATARDILIAALSEPKPGIGDILFEAGRALHAHGHGFSNAEIDDIFRRRKDASEPASFD